MRKLHHCKNGEYLGLSGLACSLSREQKCKKILFEGVNSGVLRQSSIRAPPNGATALPLLVAGGAACRGSASGEFILPAVPDAARTAVVDHRQLTGKMKSTALEKNTTGSASPRRTIVLSLTTASSVILVLKRLLDRVQRR